MSKNVFSNKALRMVKLPSLRLIVHLCNLACCSLTTAVALFSLCPVSQHFDTNQSFHRYPFLIFNPLVKPDHDKSFNCLIAKLAKSENALQGQPLVHLCDRDVNLCPVREENIRSALSIAPWPQQVDVLKLLGQKETINVFFLGGSMTRGAETVCNCLCVRKEDPRCPPNTVPPLEHESYCSWTSHLSRWLQRTFVGTNFEFHDYSAGGRTSQSADYFIDVVRSSTANLSNPALFFLDYSVNDAQAQVYSGLETLIRTIYNNFGQHYNVRPTIVVLEQYPHASIQGTVLQRVKRMNTRADYAMAYRRICKHYNVALISLREVFWTYYGEPKRRNILKPNITQRYYPLSPFVTVAHVHVHPPWYVHLFMADVLAACILHIISDSAVITASSMYIADNKPQVSARSAILPAPLYDISTEIQHVCDLSAPYIVDAIARSTTPSHEVNMSNGWVEYLDHHTPGWVINNLSHNNSRALSFPIASDAALSNNIVRISYLRSYEGMGTATVYLCGLPLSGAVVLEGLWTRPVSIPHTYAVSLGVNDVANCTFLPPDKRTIEVIYTPGEDQNELRSLHQHQFKVFTVQICKPISQI